MDTKRFRDFEIKSESQGTVSAVFCSFDVRDLDGDVVRRGAFTDGAPVVISAFGHKSWDGALPIGKGKIRVGSNEAIMDGRLFLNTSNGRDAFETIKHLSEAGLQEWSFSLENTKSTRGTLAGEPVRFIDKVTVTEVSPVLKGAGIGTRTLAVKQHGTALPADLASSCLQHIAEHKAAQRAELERIYANVVLGSAREMLASLVDQHRRQRVYVATQPKNDTIAAEARKVCQMAATELGIEPPPLYWYRPATPREKSFHERYSYLPGEFFTDERNLNGFCRNDDASPAIAVRATLDRDCLLSIVAHEVRHAAGGDELDARAYEREWLERVTAVPEFLST